MKRLGHIPVVWAERWLSHLRDLWENDLVALRRNTKMDSLFTQRCSIKGPFNFKWSSQLFPLCSWWRWGDLHVRYHQWSNTLRNKLWYGGSGHTDWVHEIFFRCSRSQIYHFCPQFFHVLILLTSWWFSVLKLVVSTFPLFRQKTSFHAARPKHNIITLKHYWNLMNVLLTL